MRPPSIVRFDRFYLASIAVGLVGNVLDWPAAMARLASNPQTAQLGPTGAVVAGGTIAAGTAIALLLWYLIARRGSGIAKWVLVVFSAFAIGSVFIALATGTLGGNAAGVVRMVAVVLQLVAVVALFRPDARPWFAPAPVEERDA